MRISASTNTLKWSHPEPGNYPASCIRIIDLGTQTGKYGEKRKIKLVFELLETEGYTSKETGEVFPFTVHKEYNPSLNDAAGFRKDIENWMNRKLTESELNNFDTDILLGKGAFVTVAQNKVSEDKIFSNIGSIAPAPKSFVFAKAVNEIFSFNIGVIGWEEIYKKLNENDKKKIALSPEYQLANSVPLDNSAATL